MTLADDYRALREGAAFVRVPRQAINVTGPEAFDYLQGQLSQDFAPLAVGRSTWSLLLQPQGKVEAFVRVTRTDEAAFLLDVDAGWGEAVVARLERFKLRVKADITLVGWDRVRIMGEGDGLAYDWPPLKGVDVRDPKPAHEAGPDAWEVLRIEAGVPVLGAELTDRTIPAEVETVVERGVSFTKGCFTGQELVARIDARGGNVPRHLRRLIVDGPVPPPGAAIVVDDREVGAITSAAQHPDGHVVALGFVRRDVAVPAQAAVAGAGVARIEPLALLS
jgi:folate-binding protein YgfZ